MKKYTPHKILILLLHLFAGSVIVIGQVVNPEIQGENVSLMTDRNLYITGEKIYFSAYVYSETGIRQANPGVILYCEIITTDGTKISGNKFLIENSVSSGSLSIPEDMATGIYYLRAYTKFMRNGGPEFYAYSLIKIVNPNREEVQPDSDFNNTSQRLISDEAPVQTGDSFMISSERPRYATTDTVKLSISGKGSDQTVWKLLSLSVVPEYSASEKSFILSGDGRPDNKEYYYPETRGLSVTGKLTDSKTSIPVPDTKINLSIIGQGRDFMAMQTDTAGRFYFSLPSYSGSRDIFLCAENKESVDPKILVDNDFCTLPVQIQSGTFSLSTQERKAAFDLAVNMQLESFFNIDTIAGNGKILTEEKGFYGQPNEILYIDNYIQLPTLEEYFNELPTLVKVRKREGDKYFKILGPQTGLTEYDPLVMVDLVAIDDLSKILAIPPVNISRIEIVNELYVKGDQTYGGIINIISKRSDFAGIDLPSSGIFINYDFLADSTRPPEVNSLQYSPDTRNTLYWEPRLVLNNGNAADVIFQASDTPGRYQVILNCINSGGEVFRQTAEFEVLK